MRNASPRRTSAARRSTAAPTPRRCRRRRSASVGRQPAWSASSRLHRSKANPSCPRPASPQSEVPAPPALQPMLAAEDRTVDAALPLDLEALQRNLLEDLKRQLRTEFERGA